MPVAAVAGRAEVMTRAGREGGRHVRFDGGTYSAHPASMMAGKLMLEYLIEHEDEIYGRLAEMGQQMRQRLEQIFAEHGILAQCTGYPNEALTGSSLAVLHFPVNEDIVVDSPDVAADPACCNMEVRERALKLALLWKTSMRCTAWARFYRPHRAGPGAPVRGLRPGGRAHQAHSSLRYRANPMGRVLY